MTDGPSLELRQEQEPEESLCLYNLEELLNFYDPHVETIAGMLELLGNALYRQGRFTEGSEVKHVAQELRGQ